GHAFEQDVAAGQQCNEELVGDAFHADDDLADLGDGLVAQRAHPLRELADCRAVRFGTGLYGHAFSESYSTGDGDAKLQSAVVERAADLTKLVLPAPKRVR